MAAPKSRINTEFYNKNTIELELKGSNFNGVFTCVETIKKIFSLILYRNLNSYEKS